MLSNLSWTAESKNSYVSKWQATQISIVRKTAQQNLVRIDKWPRSMLFIPEFGC